MLSWRKTIMVKIIKFAPSRDKPKSLKLNTSLIFCVRLLMFNTFCLFYFTGQLCCGGEPDTYRCYNTDTTTVSISQPSSHGRHAHGRVSMVIRHGNKIFTGI